MALKIVIFVVREMYTPICEDEIKLWKGKQFLTIEIASLFYKPYARAVGFDVRMSSAKRVGKRT